MITVLLALATVAADPKPEASAPAAPVAAAAPAKERRYCFDDQTTGSRISRRVCRTKAEWKDLGVKVDR